MQENEIVNLFTAGDIFDKSKRKDWSFNQFQANKKRLQRFKDAGINLYSNLGNHDQLDGAETADDTVFGEMVDLGLIHYIGSEMEPVRFNNEVGEVLLFGIDYHQSTDQVQDEFQEISAFPRGQQSVKICLTHSNITSSTEMITDFSYRNLSKYDIDTICCGHYHIAADIVAQELNKTYFLNPWNLTRVARDYHAKLDEHRPEFIHARIHFIPDSDPIYNFEEIFLEVGKFSETFNIDIISMLQELGKTKFGFFEEVGENLHHEEDLNDDEILLKRLAEKHVISKEAVVIAKELLG